MKLHPQVIEKDGRGEFVVLPFQEFKDLEELMQDYEDLQDLRKAKNESIGEKGVPIEKIISDLDL